MTTQSAAMAPSSSPATCSALAAASAHTTPPGEASGPRPAMTRSSSTPDTTTTGSMPAWRSTLRRPGDADPSTTRVIYATRPRKRAVPPRSRLEIFPSRHHRRRRGSLLHVDPCLQGDSLEVGHRVTQPVDRQPPAGALALFRFRCSAADAAEHGHQRGDLLDGGLPLEDLDVRLVRLLSFVGHGFVAHSGMFPCFLGGRC